MLKEKIGINCASAEAQFGTGRGFIYTLCNTFWPLKSVILASVLECWVGVYYGHWITQFHIIVTKHTKRGKWSKILCVLDTP